MRTASEEKRKTRSSCLLVPVLLCLAVGRLAAQTVTEFPIPNGLTKGITAGPDGNLWFAQDNYIGRITPTGMITRFMTPTANSWCTGITAGPDGNLWFTEKGQGIVGRITPSGVITEFLLDDPFAWPPSAPAGIVAGPDGNLWFAEQEGRIGRISTSGQVARFPVIPVPIYSADPYVRDIAVGSDGNLWFTEPGGTKIGRITTAGVISEFPVPTPSSKPMFLTAGPDGNLWFTELGACQIGRITTAGVIREFPMPSIDNCIRDFSFYYIGPWTITAGPDGNLWFTEFLNSTVGRVTPAGVITEFPLPTWRNPYGITTGPDGNLWLAEESSPDDVIARFTLPAVPPSPGANFYTVTPCRVIDTRSPAGSYGGPALLSEATRVFAMAGQCGIPSGAVAVAVNIAVTQPTNGPGFLTLYPAGGPRPIASSINFSAGQTRANNAILPVGAGALAAYCGQGGGSTHLILDVTGYFQ